MVELYPPIRQKDRVSTRSLLGQPEQSFLRLRSFFDFKEPIYGIN